MLLPVYVLVAIINILAKTQNFNYQPPKDLPYEIRVRRDLINYRTEEEVNPINGFEGNKVMKKKVPQRKMKNFLVITDGELKVDVPNEHQSDMLTEAKRVRVVTDGELKGNDTNKKQNDTSKLDDNVYEYITILRNHLQLVKKFEHETRATTLNRNGQSQLDMLNSIKGIRSKHTYNNDRDKVTLYDQKLEKNNPSGHNFRTITARHFDKQNNDNTDKRLKRNFNTNAYNQNSYSTNDPNGYSDINHMTNNDLARNGMSNHPVTEKSTFGKAYSWLKSLVHSHEKYIITDVPGSNTTNDTLGVSYTDYSAMETHNTPYNQWNTGTNYYNDNVQPLGSKQHMNTTQTVTKSVNNGKNQYNYSNQQYSYNGYTDYKPGNAYNGLYPTNNLTGNAYTRYPNNYKVNAYHNVNHYLYNSTNYNNGYGYPYNGTYDYRTGINRNYTGYNNANYYYTGINGTGYGFNPFPAYNATELSDNETSNEAVVVEGCILCSSFGCPKDTRRIGLRCIPIKRRN